MEITYSINGIKQSFAPVWMPDDQLPEWNGIAKVGQIIQPFQQNYKYKVLSIEITGKNSICIELAPECEHAKKVFHDTYIDNKFLKK